MRNLRGQWLVLTSFGLLGLAVSHASAQEPRETLKPIEPRNLNESLKEVINRGARIFNENGDYAGCFRLYEGALVSVRPFVSKQLQKEIELSLNNAGRMPSFADKAFELRRVLDAIRVADAGTTTTEKTATKKTPDKEAAKDGGNVKGMVTFKGRPVPGGTVAFHAVEGAPGFKSNIDAGRYSVAGLPIGRYEVTVSGGGLPASVTDSKRGGIVFRVSPGDQTFDIDLHEPKKADDLKKEILGEPKKSKKDDEFKPDPKKEVLGDPKKTKKDAELKPDPLKEVLGDPKKSKIDGGKTPPDKGPFGDIMGIVKVDGRPLTDGEISLVSEGRPRYTTKLEKDGTYKFGNVSVGRYRIVIEPGKKEEKLVDARYRDAERSGLQFEVTEGKAVFDIIVHGPKK